jgi:hypothetical protein
MLVAVAALGLAASVVVAATLASAPANRANADISHGGSTFGDQIKHNAEALQRSRAWWENHGQRRVDPRRSPTEWHERERKEPVVGRL